MPVELKLFSNYVVKVFTCIETNFQIGENTVFINLIFKLK